MFKRKGFTLLELIIVVIIIGVLAGIAIPQYLSAVERAKVAKAKANLLVLSSAEKMYRANGNNYFVVITGTDLAPLDVWTEGIKESLSNDPDWGYTVAAGTDTFEATATRASGTDNGCTITIDYANKVGGTHRFAK